MKNPFKKKNRSKEETELAELVDAAYDIIELYKPDSPYGIIWRKQWLEKAKRCVPEMNVWY